MSWYIVTTPAGRVLRAIQSEEEPSEHDLPDPPPFAVLKFDEWPGWPAAPFPAAELHFASGALAWIDPRPLAELKAAKNAEINAARLAANRKGFQFAGKTISTDELSRGDIDGTNGIVTLTGQFPAGWQGYWKAEDNTLVAVPDLETWKQFYAAMAARGAANFATSQALKAVLSAASSAEEIAAVVWPSG